MPDLLPAQVEGAKWLAGRKRALLGDGPRVGKTPQAITAADMIGAWSILVVCPGIARENWAREFDRFSLVGRPIAVVEHHSAAIEPNGITIVAGDATRNGELRARLRAVTWDVLIVDEQQDYKSPLSQRANYVLSVHGVAAKARRIWFLTGTPMLNHPGELWIILVTIGIYRDKYSAFLNRYTDYWQSENGPIVKALKNVEELKGLLARVMLRRTFYEIFPDAPKPTWEQVELDPTKTDPADVAALLELEDDPRVGLRIKAVLRRVAEGEDVNWEKEIPRANFSMLRRLTAIAKIRPVSHWLGERLETGAIDKVVVFAHHTRMVNLISADLARFGAEAIHGQRKAADRQRAIDDFANKPEARVLVCQDQIARTAIDLTAANVLFFAEMDPVPNNNLQASYRVQGLKQTRPVSIYAGYLPKSTDEQITRINVRKTKMEGELFG